MIAHQCILVMFCHPSSDLCAEMLEIVWRVSYAIITAIIGFMLLWRIFGLKENAHFAKRSQGALTMPFPE